MRKESDHHLLSSPASAVRVPVWFVPFIYAAAAVLLGLTLPRLEAAFFPGSRSGMTPAAAIAVYSSVATGMIALTGLVFSLVFVMVQFSATSYSPRLVLWMSRDPLVSHAIGVFTATFLYAIAALAWVDRNNSGRVPFFSGWLVVGLVLASVGVFVGLIQSLSRLQVNNVLAFTGGFARKVIDRLYPPLDGRTATDASTTFRCWPVTQVMTYSGPPRAVQSLDVSKLLEIAVRTQGAIEVLFTIGDTLVESTPLLQVYAGREQIDQRELKRVIQTGTERTFEQDPKYSLQILRDIAIRALSPAVNDPTTAVQALDQIEDLLIRLGRRRLEIGEVCDADGYLRLVIPFPAWEDFLNMALSEIRAYGADSKQVMRRLRAVLAGLMDALPEERLPALLTQQKRLDATIARSFSDVDDQVEASADDREGLGSPCRRYRQVRFGKSSASIPTDRYG